MNSHSILSKNFSYFQFMLTNIMNGLYEEGVCLLTHLWIPHTNGRHFNLSVVSTLFWITWKYSYMTLQQMCVLKLKKSISYCEKVPKKNRSPETFHSIWVFHWTVAAHALQAVIGLSVVPRETWILVGGSLTPVTLPVSVDTWYVHIWGFLKVIRTHLPLVLLSHYLKSYSKVGHDISVFWREVQLQT
jgi:hypothetical protein